MEDMKEKLKSILRSQIVVELKNHDWWHMMSDDSRVNFAGDKHKKMIVSLLAQLPRKEAVELHNLHCPKEFIIKVQNDR